MSKVRTKFVCQQCGGESVKWVGRCPGCGEWNTMIEEREMATGNRRDRGISAVRTAPQSLSRIPAQTETRISTGLTEFDRVLGGGIVPGSLTLIGGDPGIGKSTLLLQLSNTLVSAGRTVLYISGEESAAQIKLRAERLGTSGGNLYVLSETDLTTGLESVRDVEPDLLVVDSIQTVYDPEVSSAPGSVSQIRECTSALLRVSKTSQVATFIVGHVTKDGNLAGPRLLEHMVDAVLYFEGERHHVHRVVRAVKNRFGSTNELAIFEMKDDGLQEVTNPSELFLSERTVQAPGSAVVSALEGSRPILLEVQALVAPTGFGTPRRMTSGADHNRASLLLAVLERRLEMNFQNLDTYINVVGGMRVDEPAIDLGIALAMASSFRNRPLPHGDVYIGEVGLTGEVRSVARLEQRIREADRLGFTRCIVPARSLRGWTYQGHVEVVGVNTLAEALAAAL